VDEEEGEVNILGIFTIIVAVAVAVFAVYVIRTMPAIGPRPVKADDFGELIRATAEAAEVPLDVFVLLLESESGLDPLATGPENANGSVDRGIAQLNSYYLEWFGSKYLPGQALDPYAPSKALPVAARYLRDLADLFGGCWACAVGAYKRGPSGWAEIRERGSPGHAHEAIGGAHTCR
jgi:soluble lytic murein transglycosylase-like protein